jgi:hypothetical protein
MSTDVACRDEALFFAGVLRRHFAAGSVIEHRDEK